MINIEYANAYSEVLEILKYISKEDYNKIPKEQIRLFEIYSNSNHNFIYNPLKTLDEQNTLKITKCIIAILFIDYWATEIQREKIISKHIYGKQKIEEEKKEKYNPDNLFGNPLVDNAKNKPELALIEVNDIKWYKKIWTFLKKILEKIN